MHVQSVATVYVPNPEVDGNAAEADPSDSSNAQRGKEKPGIPFRRSSRII